MVDLANSLFGQSKNVLSKQNKASFWWAWPYIPLTAFQAPNCLCFGTPITRGYGLLIAETQPIENASFASIPIRYVAENIIIVILTK